ncbi:MAG: hypothetical protein KGL18_15990 [Burkholderiales bacterium]|nr:hypothetical protein [Burkholderiales bacterium]MDE1928668.1 hypothetical protein [Burkholderiales bacterium]MDE2159626.1 hypothetical protein [Burkholderiales bacterium]MDE2504465.1 hypothetical protein [Burkholderiales bacterium]
MKYTLADWLWRFALIAALVWIGVELQTLHQDLQQQPADDQQTASSDSPDAASADSVDALRSDIALLDRKVDALMIATMQLKK